MRSLYCLLLLLTNSGAFATHISGGYIQVTPVVGQALTYRITVSLYYNMVTGSAAAAAATDLTVCFGDNSRAKSVGRSGTRLIPGAQGSLSINEYSTVYTYGGADTYTIQATAINRNDFSRNIGGGKSASTAFSVRTVVQIQGGAGRQNQTPLPSLPATGLVVSMNQRV